MNIYARIADTISRPWSSALRKKSAVPNAAGKISKEKCPVLPSRVRNGLSGPVHPPTVAVVLPIIVPDAIRSNERRR